MNRHERRAREAATRNKPSAGMQRANALIRSLIHSNEVFDRDFEVTAIERGVQGRFSCKPGCAACCDQAVLTSLAEGLLIVDRYRRVVADVAPELRRQEALLEACGLTEEVTRITDPSTRAARQAFLDNWYAERVPCAFLDKSTKLCRIYDARPLGCRSHVVLSPPELCDLRATIDGEQPSVLAYDPGPEYNVAMKHNWDTTHELVGVTAIGFIPTMVLYAFEGSGGKA